MARNRQAETRRETPAIDLKDLAGTRLVPQTTRAAFRAHDAPYIPAGSFFSSTVQ
jgi:hypothetical protein